MNKILLFLIIILAFANSVKTLSKNEKDTENLSNKAVLKIRHHQPQPQQTGGSAPG
ncbi:30040_t:CDS:1, partial [Racocetra persica]